MDPKAELQLQHSALFARPVEAWHALDPRQRKMYDRAAVGMIGYNLFIALYLKAARDGQESGTTQTQKLDDLPP